MTNEKTKTKSVKKWRHGNESHENPFVDSIGDEIAESDRGAAA